MQLMVLSFSDSNDTILTNLASSTDKKVPNTHQVWFPIKRVTVSVSRHSQDKIFSPLKKGVFWLGRTVLVCTCANDNNHGTILLQQPMYMVQHIKYSTESDPKMSERPFKK